MRTLFDQYVVNVIRDKRVAINMSQEDLSIKLGFKSNGFVGQIENPRSTKKYNVVHINKAALIFNCSPKDFLPQDPIKNNEVIKPLTKKGKNAQDRE
jgi:transcriptional regulator with XRE-family HTH domain